MDLKKIRELWKKALEKENTLRLVVALGICGIALLAISSWDFSRGSGAPTQPQEEAGADYAGYARTLEEDLARIVGAITGEREPVVMVTLEDMGQRVYAADRQESAQSGPEGEGSTTRESAHVILEDGEGAQRALSVSEVQPKVQGVVIVSKHGADPSVREKLVNAAKTALGLPASRVCVVG